ncbi:DHA2 family efflux MFS transporter permease subunit [Chryseobacterium sp. JV558]|uniref:DHA2 family efflux MFS transporter permease subunit n=1 Tax=Chryseobacterium sp. JV558 TaxID=2663236 RepID=UPI00299D1F32|nr:DHA2 family efflux MFS transporter permease subunit [Chryseobacterium sp. JV558]MDW9379687.1 DHA2 family efflux MFS transporter permease subunit [Chryseobacterium sp. JV558]
MNRILLIITVISAAIMELIDTSIVNVAINHMSGSLGATLEDTSWVVTSYGIANVIIIPMTGFLVNNLGRRNYYIGSLILFTLCSFMCGNATSIWELVAFRFLQGIGGGALLSVSATVVYECFPKEKQNIASALFGIGVFIGPTIGPTLGGNIIDNYSWSWIFYINIPIGIITAIICYRLLPESPTRKKVKEIDWIGITLLIVGVGSLQTILERGETEDWFETRYITALTITAFFSIILFVYRELTTAHPVVKLSILQSPSLSISALLTFITGMGMFTSIYLTPVLAQRLLQFTPSMAGLMLLPGSIIAVFALIITGRILQKGVPPALIVLIGFCCFIYFNWSMSQVSLDVSFAIISVNLIFRAMGMALLTVPLSTLAISSLKPEDIPQGTAINNMMRQLGGSFGISIINTFIIRRMAEHRTDLVSNITPTNNLVTERLNNYTQLFQSKGFGLQDAQHRAISLMDMIVQKQAFILSYIDAYLLIGAAFVLCLPLLLFFSIKKGNKKVIIASADH